MARISRANAEKLNQLKRDIGQYKSALIAIEKEIATISQPQADKLGAIIGRLEDFQNR